MHQIKLAMFIKLIGVAFLLLGSQGYSKTLPEDSIYQLNSAWVDQDGSKRLLSSYSGKKQVLSLIYTHCLHTCPTIVSTMQAIEHKLSDEEKNNVGFILVSLTPDTDTPAVMRDFAQKRQLNTKNWSLLTGAAEDVRSLAMILDVKYQNVADNEVNHSNLITVLDEQGRIQFQEIGELSSANKAVEKLKNL